MKITNKIPESKPTRYISTCCHTEAFKFGSEWYTLIQSNFIPVINSCDDIVEMFVDEHMHRDSRGCDLLPCIELSTMVLVFLEDKPVDEWVNVEAVLTAHS